MKVLALIASICAAFALAACGGGSSTASDEGATTAEQTSTEAESSERPVDTEPTSRASKPTKPPKVTVPPGPPPKQLVVEDLKRGTGTVLKYGTELAARYVAVDYKTGKVVEDKWREPFEWSYGPGEVVEAWVKGLKGMRVGGVRKLTAPSRLAYNEGAWIWVVELLSVTDLG